MSCSTPERRPPSLGDHSPPAEGAGALTLSLPVVPPAKTNSKDLVRASAGLFSSRTSKWRWTVLLTVQALMIAHVVQWLFTGRTSTPIEPSEAMEAVKHGVINVGAIFFAAALLSTAVFGRWVCGWVCHIVLLQDFCAWALGKAGIRPRAFRSRLLVFIPLALALYMFVWPVAYRLAIAPWLAPNLSWPGWSLHLTTTEFWRTFPGVLVAVPFLLVCGFVAVYFLGAKGYCTYGCPYGGFFAPLDELAPMRIRVTDACEHCGHCTAACSSNVRVHEEVRDYGMVVDPGCMKCMDCVSVCPNDALYLGFGRPAASAKPRVAPERVAQRRYDLTWPEEIAFAGLALTTFMAVRGLYGVIPLLMASGITACVVFICWKAWRVLRDPSVQLHRVQLRLKGRLRPAGAGLLALAVACLAFVAHSAVVSGAYALAAWHDDRVTMPPQMVFSEAPMALTEEMAEHADRGERLYALASYVGDGGIGLGWAWQPNIDLRRAWLLSAQLRFPEAEALLRRSLERYGDHQAIHAGLARVLRAQHREDEALAYVSSVLERRPEYAELLDETCAALESEGRSEDAMALCRAGLARDPDNLMTMRRLSLLLVLHGEGADLDEGIALVRRTLELAPGNAFGHYALALGLGKRGDLEAAEQEMRRAVELAPDEPRLNAAMAELLTGLGRASEATPYRLKAEGMTP